MTQHLSTAAVKLTQLRELMQQRGIDAWVVMSADPHLSEYLPEHWKIRQWLTGFTGSVGTVVVAADQAGLWVDGRYWVQAEQQLHGTGFSLQKQTPDPNSSHLAWLEQQLAAGATIAVDGRIISVQQFDALQHIALKNRFELISDADLISPIWQSRPDLPAEPVWEMQAGLNALTRAEKIEKIRQHLADQHIHAHFISALDDIAWILNCRGSDVDYNPVFLAHLYIDAAQVVVFIDSTKVSAELKQILHQDQIQVRDYAQAAAFLNVIHAKNILATAHAHALGDGNRGGHGHTNCIERTVAYLSTFALTSCIVVVLGRQCGLGRVGLCTVYAKTQLEHLTTDSVVSLARWLSRGLCHQRQYLYSATTRFSDFNRLNHFWPNLNVADLGSLRILWG